MTAEAENEETEQHMTQIQSTTNEAASTRQGTVSGNTPGHQPSHLACGGGVGTGVTHHPTTTVCVRCP